MPQATERLRRMFADDRVAWNVLGPHFYSEKGIIRQTDPKYKPTKRQWDAIDYLFQEWDYEYQPPSRQGIAKG